MSRGRRPWARERIGVGRRELRDGGSRSAGLSACSQGSWGLQYLWVSPDALPGPLSFPCFAFLGWNIPPSPSWSAAALSGSELLEVVISISWGA